MEHLSQVHWPPSPQSPPPPPPAMTAVAAKVFFDFLLCIRNTLTLGRMLESIAVLRHSKYSSSVSLTNLDKVNLKRERYSKTMHYSLNFIEIKIQVVSLH